MASSKSINAQWKLEVTIESVETRRNVEPCLLRVYSNGSSRVSECSVTQDAGCFPKTLTLFLDKDIGKHPVLAVSIALYTRLDVAEILNKQCQIVLGFPAGKAGEEEWECSGSTRLFCILDGLDYREAVQKEENVSGLRVKATIRKVPANSAGPRKSNNRKIHAMDQAVQYISELEGEYKIPPTREIMNDWKMEDFKYADDMLRLIIMDCMQIGQLTFPFWLNHLWWCRDLKVTARFLGEYLRVAMDVHALNNIPGEAASLLAKIGNGAPSNQDIPNEVYAERFERVYANSPLMMLRLTQLFSQLFPTSVPYVSDMRHDQYGHIRHTDCASYLLEVFGGDCEDSAAFSKALVELLQHAPSKFEEGGGDPVLLPALSRLADFLQGWEARVCSCKFMYWMSPKKEVESHAVCILFPRKRQEGLPVYVNLDGVNPYDMSTFGKDAKITKQFDDFFSVGADICKEVEGVARRTLASLPPRIFAWDTAEKKDGLDDRKNPSAICRPFPLSIDARVSIPDQPPSQTSQSVWITRVLGEIPQLCVTKSSPHVIGVRLSEAVDELDLVPVPGMLRERPENEDVLDFWSSLNYPQHQIDFEGGDGMTIIKCTIDWDRLARMQRSDPAGLPPVFSCSLSASAHSEKFVDVLDAYASRFHKNGLKMSYCLSQLTFMGGRISATYITVALLPTK